MACTRPSRGERNDRKNGAVHGLLLRTGVTAAAPLPTPIHLASDGQGAVCGHCALPLGTRAIEGGFCCEGCRQVHHALREANLSRYYALRGSREGMPATLGGTDEPETKKWLVREEEALRGEVTTAPRRYAVEGLHCSGCVWLIERVFADVEAGGRVDVNPARGTIDLHVGATFPLVRFAERLARFGYKLAPSLPESSDGDLLLRLGVCVALAMNAMILAVAIYAGLRDGELYRLFQLLSLGLCGASAYVGGTVFFRGALAGARARVFTLDMPIALGIALGFAGSTVSYFVDGGAHAYFDTLTVFIALMLLGRYLRERVVSESRCQLARSEDAERLLVRRTTTDGAVEIVSVSAVTPGDVLLLLPGDIAPVDGRLIDARATVDCAWISGEATPRAAIAGEVVPSGGRNAGGSAVRTEALHPWKGSTLERTLSTPTTESRDAALAGRSRIEAAVARAWVPGVLLAATGAFVGHVTAHGDVYRALTVTVALLVVTCPCAFGIATPLGHELVLARLRREGLLVRSHSFLERAAEVKLVVLDKTGTLTESAIEGRRDTLSAGVLDLDDERALFNMVVRSSHPKAAALLDAVSPEARRFDPSARVLEVTGQGIEATINGHRYLLGRAAFAGGGAEDTAGMRFTRDGDVLGTLHVDETLRGDAVASIRALERMGLVACIASGDNEARVSAIADRCGIPRDRARFGQTPEMKAAFVAAHAADKPLMLGDGLNDTLATEAAYCSGTAVAGRTFLAARADFHLLTPGIGAVCSALDLARRLRAVVQANLALAVFYNLVAVLLSVAGIMSPLVCAIFMPASSLLAISHTTLRLRAP